MCLVLPWIQTFTEGQQDKFDGWWLLDKGTPCASILAYKGFTCIGNEADGLGGFFASRCDLKPFCFSSNQLTKEMVMEKPSAQLVGREFVRQYYTLLNQAPDYLHR